MRALAARDPASARARLTELAARDPSDPIVTSMLGDLERAAGDHSAASGVATAAAQAAKGDPELASALELEAFFERWRAGERSGAIEDLEASGRGVDPAAAKMVLAWAWRALGADTLEGRRTAVERSATAGASDVRVLALERFALEVAGGDPDAASAAIATIDDSPEGDFGVAGALARLVWSQGSANPPAVREATERLGARGPQALTFAMAEAARLAREGGDHQEMARASRRWFDAGGGLPAAIEWLGAAEALGEAREEHEARLAVAVSLSGEAREAMIASAAIVESLAEPDRPPAWVSGEAPSARLANLELSPAGCDPRRRATALSELDGVLGPQAHDDAESLAAWSDLAAGEVDRARARFERAAASNPGDLAAWEGLRACAEAAGDRNARARAAAELGARCKDARRGAAFWEEAALLWLELGDEANIDRALEQSFARDARRGVAFDKLFRRVRARKDNDRLLPLIVRRLDVADEPQEVLKLFWEQARVLREKGDQDAALQSLEHVTMLDPDHVGALALLGEINIRRGHFEDAATSLSRLAMLDGAPAKSRVTAGIAAVDLYENKLDRFDKALEVLLVLHQAKLSTLPVRERLARAAARTGAWNEATAMLEELMNERADAQGRVEAARLAMNIHRDRLGRPQGAAPAIVKLLEESPADGEALEMFLQTEHSPALTERLLEAARRTLVDALQKRPTEGTLLRRLATVTRALSDDAAHRAAVGVLVALGAADGRADHGVLQLAKSRAPLIAMNPAMLRSLRAPGDDGPLSDLFVLLGPTLSDALGPTLVTCGVGRRDKVDPRSGLGLRNEIAAWAGAFGVREFDLYIGGSDPLGVQGISGDTPALVVGSGFNAPMAPALRGRVARELMAIVRGTGATRHRDDSTIAAVVVVACKLADVPKTHPPYAVLAEVERLIGKAIARRTRKLLGEPCRAIVTASADARLWSRHALSSQDRAAVLASGDPGVVLVDALGPEGAATADAAGSARAQELFRFVLSPLPRAPPRARPRGGRRVMTDEKKPDELGDLDWDQALSEWESTNFVPEVVKDAPADKPGPAAGATRPLYRPPTATRAKLPGPVRLYDPDEEANEATRIARVPEELLRRQEGLGALPREEFVDLVAEAARRPAPIEPAAERTAPTVGEHGERPGAPEKAPSASRTLLVPKLRRYDPNEVTAVGRAGQLTGEQAIDVEEMPASEPPPPPPPVPVTRERPARRSCEPPSRRPGRGPKKGPRASGSRRRSERSWRPEPRGSSGKHVPSMTPKRGRELSSRAARCSRCRGTASGPVTLAVEARDAAPSVALAHRQARGLAAPSAHERDDDTAALDAESAASPTDAGRTHAALLAAEALRAAGQEDAAADRFEAVARSETRDVRAAIARATRALARDAAAADVTDVPEWAALREAVAVCVRLRGVERGGARAVEERLPNELVLLARQALDRGDAGQAATWVRELAVIPELASGAKWLAASLAAARPAGRPDAIRWLEDLAERGDPEARRALVERALESGDAARLEAVVATPGGISSAERATVAALSGAPLAASDPHLDAASSTPGMETLAAALSAIAVPRDDHRDADIEARGRRLAGSSTARALARLGRLLAASARPAEVEAALADAGDARGGEVRAISMEMATRKGQTSDVAGALEAWGAGWGSREEGAIGALAAALVAERAGDVPRAADAFKAARGADPTQEASLRALASLENVDLVSDLNGLADELGEGLRGAILRIEAAKRGEGMLPDPTRAMMLEQAYEAARGHPIAPFLAERIARRGGDVDETLRWIRAGRADSKDVVEAALDAVREALLLAERDPHVAGDRLREAHRARPDDVALRELHDRLVMDPPEARAAWRELRASTMTGASRALFLIDAAREFERAGDEEAALRCAEAAGASDAGLGAVARERAEVGSPRVARLAEELLAAAKGAADVRDRREAYERLAVVDATVRQDPASALLWHRAILEESPGHEPSLRHVEQHLVGEGRDEELEPIAVGIADALRESLDGEGAAHAELAARLRLRSSDARWDDTREMVELAASAPEPSLWSLRMVHAHARARGDDEVTLATARKLVERASRPADRAAFLALAGETAVRLERLDEARSLLEQAIVEDAGDIATWQLLAEVRQRGGDARGAAEAYEALARSSQVTAHQFEAWQRAARVYADASDAERAMLALEAAAALDPANADVFTRLSSLYAARKMHSGARRVDRASPGYRHGLRRAPRPRSRARPRPRRGGGSRRGAPGVRGRARGAARGRGRAHLVRRPVRVAARLGGGRAGPHPPREAAPHPGGAAERLRAPR